MSLQKTIIEGNDLIHHFLDGRWKGIRRNPGGHWQVIDRIFKNKINCQTFCDKNNKWVKDGNLWTAAPHVSNFILRYHESWDSLMPVIAKIESFHLSVGICTDSCYIMSRGVEDEFYPWLSNFPETEFYVEGIRTADQKITSAWTVCLLFIDWYNTQND